MAVTSRGHGKPSIRKAGIGALASKPMRVAGHASAASASSKLADGKLQKWIEATRSDADWRPLLDAWREVAPLPQAEVQTLYGYLHGLDPLRYIHLARAGIPASATEMLAQALHMPAARMHKALNLPASTVARKIKLQENLPVDQSERVIQTMRLVGLAQRLVSEYGDPELSQGFDAARWFGEWIEEPNPALGMQKPVDLLDTAAGASLVESLLNKMVSGVYA